MGFDNKVLYLTKADKYLTELNVRKHDRFKMIYDFFEHQREQINNVFSLIHHNKGYERPLGLEYEALVNTFCHQQICGALFKDKDDLRKLLNTMAHQTFNLLEFRPGNKSYNITPFGYEYWIETTNKLKNNSILNRDLSSGP